LVKFLVNFILLVKNLLFIKLYEQDSTWLTKPVNRKRGCQTSEKRAHEYVFRHLQDGTVIHRSTGGPWCVTNCLWLVNVSKQRFFAWQVAWRLNRSVKNAKGRHLAGPPC